MLHADYFRYEVVEKTLFSEELGKEGASGRVDEPVLVVFISSESVDEKSPPLTASRAVESIVDIAKRIKVENIVLHSFAHLSSNLARPEVARRIIEEMYQKLRSMGYRVLKTPFGWREVFELRVKGHAISKVSRTILPE